MLTVPSGQPKLTCTSVPDRHSLPSESELPTGSAHLGLKFRNQAEIRASVDGPPIGKQQLFQARGADMYAVISTTLYAMSPRRGSAPTGSLLPAPAWPPIYGDEQLHQQLPGVSEAACTQNCGNMTAWIAERP